MTMTIPTSNDENWYPAGTSGSKVNSMYVRLSINSNTTTGYFDLNFDIYVSAGGAGGGLITAVKLELGTHQTLAHQDAAGNWVLNDPPPDKTLEMLKCQRYYQVFSSADMRPVKAVDFRPPMRVDPAFSTIEINGVTYYTADANL